MGKLVKEMKQFNYEKREEERERRGGVKCVRELCISIAKIYM